MGALLADGWEVLGWGEIAKGLVEVWCNRSEGEAEPARAGAPPAFERVPPDAQGSRGLRGQRDDSQAS